MFTAAFTKAMQQRPVAVMSRAVVERFFEPSRLDELFEQTARKQYKRKLLFSSVVELMYSVVLAAEPTVYSAYRKRQSSLPVSDDSIYNKLNGMELGVMQALVRDAAARAAEAIDELGQRKPSWLPGCRVRILDGNAPSATEHRLEVLRDTWAAPLPGKILAVMDPEIDCACDVFLTPDGHAQERSLLGEVLETVKENDLWIADRNFCTQPFLFGIAAKSAFFVLRQHGSIVGKLKGERRFVGDSKTGKVYEQAIELTVNGQTQTFRRITIELNTPTRDGDWTLHVLSNLAPSVSALLIAELYSRRWSIETLFYEVTQTLQCELKTMGYPPAALFAFCLALVAASGVAVLKAALRATHGEQAASEMSPYYMALEMKQMSEGLSVLVEPKEWTPFRTMTLAEFASKLKELAGHMRLAYYRKSKRGPKKPPAERTPYKNGGHLSTYKALRDKLT
jgi:hypothetical protein